MGSPFFIKQGALLQLNLQVQQDDTTPVDITGSVLFSEIRDQFGNLVATPTLTVTNATAGQVTYSAQSDTTWPVGQLKSDIYITVGSDPLPWYTETFFIRVAAPVTQIADRT